MIFFPLAFMFSPISISWGGRVHQPEPKCHFDLYPTFSFLGGYISNFLSFPTFSNRFTPMWLKITHNCKFGLKCGLDWVKMTKFGHFTGFSIFFPIFSPKMRLRLTRNGQFYLIHNFSHLFLPRHLISWEISKIFISGRGVHQQIFWVGCTDHRYSLHVEIRQVITEFVSHSFNIQLL